MAQCIHCGLAFDAKVGARCASPMRKERNCESQLAATISPPPPTPAMQGSHNALPRPPAVPRGTQVGGTHYAKLAIDPLAYSMANGLPHAEGAVVKYVTRWRDKGGIQDLEKAMSVLQRMIDHEKARHGID